MFPKKPEMSARNRRLRFRDYFFSPQKFQGEFGVSGDVDMETSRNVTTPLCCPEISRKTTDCTESLVRKNDLGPHKVNILVLKI